ncbi:hypothetical protein A4X13_0g8875, partial [Tilletia indica]
MAGSAARKAVKSANSLSDQELSQLAFSELQDAGSSPSLDERGISFASKKGKSFILGTTLHTSALHRDLKAQVLALLRSNMKE